MSKRFVVHIINNLNRGGAETLLLNICKGILESNRTVHFHVILLSDQEDLCEEFHRTGITTEVIPLYCQPLLSSISRLTKRLKQLRPDVVHSHLLQSDRIALIAGFLSGVSVRLSTLHSMDRYENRNDQITLWLTRLFSTKLIAVSNAARNFFVENRLFPAAKIEVIRNAPPNISSFSAEPRQKKDTDQFINVGRLHILKGQIYLIRAMKILRERGFTCSLIICGPRDQEEILRNEIREQNLEDCIELAGLVNDVTDRLKKADYFVASSICEGFHLALVEALIEGLPAVVTDLPAHQEIFESNVTYPLPFAEPSNPESLADSMEKALRLDRNGYRACSEMSLLIAENFNFDTMIDAYSKLYSI